MATNLIPVMAEMNKADDLWQFFEEWRENSGSTSPPHARLAIGFDANQVELVLHGTSLRDIYAAALPTKPTLDSQSKRLEIHVIDGAESDLPLPRLGWSTSDFGPKRRVPGWCDAAKTTYVLRTEKGIAVADWAAQRAFVWLPSHTALPWWERAAPLRWLFDGLAQRLDMVTVHAAAVGIDGRGVIIGGPGGAGKSTLALACVARGMDFVSDDYCLLRVSNKPACKNLFTTAKLEKHSPLAPSIARGLNLRSTDMSGGKAILFLDDSRIVRELSIEAIVLPRLAAQARTERLSSEEGFRQIAPSTIAQSEANGASIAASLAALVRSVPAYRLDISRDLDGCVEMVSDLVKK
jgi:hypothetical protein